ncbi:hypothetical protein, partial [Geotalea toluenoxydans]|uniref:hypothetical protein n=1 Tax=Geotalea toluenoxydans TaxID=421624 RepID=UPI000B269B71
DRLYLLQSRPITSLATLPDPDGGLNIWDNSNIVESYGGVTTPLTFSFARHIYEGVYRQFCRIMAVPADAIAANERIFPRMLGLVRGRVYYNLLNWYRLLAMLPGFTSNRRFMEQMMGLRRAFPSISWPKRWRSTGSAPGATVSIWPAAWPASSSIITGRGLTTAAFSNV